jgi:hypothetical protein
MNRPVSEEPRINSLLPLIGLGLLSWHLHNEAAPQRRRSCAIGGSPATTAAPPEAPSSAGHTIPIYREIALRGCPGHDTERRLLYVLIVLVLLLLFLVEELREEWYAHSNKPRGNELPQR